MRLSVSCTHCNRQFAVLNEWVGKNVECPFCKGTFKVQRASRANSTENKAVVSPSYGARATPTMSASAAVMATNGLVGNHVSLLTVPPAAFQETATSNTQSRPLFSSTDHQASFESHSHYNQVPFIRYEQVPFFTRRKKIICAATVAVPLIWLLLPWLRGQPSTATMEQLVRGDIYRSGEQIRVEHQFWGFMYMRLEVVELNEVKINEVGRFNRQENYWPVRVGYQGKGRESDGKTRYFSNATRYAIYKDDFGKWHAKRLGGY